jgi:ppGpp synthetase/RelA/SpoT-type nucleotidyltranferase
MSTTKTKILDQWQSDKKLYKKLTNYIHDSLESSIREEGISVRVLARTKDDKSLMKKLYKKGLDQYTHISDKSAARVICKFRQDTVIVCEVINKLFLVEKEEDKIHALNFNEQGYKSLHFDVRVNEDNIDSLLYSELKDLYAEIQVRTNCEDTWAEIYHDIGYKANSDLSSDIKREFHCLAGLLEVADNSFALLNEKVVNIEVLNEEFVLNYLKTFFIKKVDNKFDYDFSYENLQILLPISPFSSTNNFKSEMDTFLSQSVEQFDFIFYDHEADFVEIPYLSQPEIFLIYYLIENDLHSLRDRWIEFDLYLDDLERLCLLWGIPLDDFELQI